MPLPRVYVGATMDLPHAGHIRFLKQCAKHGDVIVALNTDEFAARYKRPPIMTLEERMEVISSLRYVHACEVNEGDEDSTVMIRKWLPKYVAHGDDWTGEALMVQMGLTQTFLDEIGTKMLYLPYTAGISTSNIMDRVRAYPF